MSKRNDTDPMFAPPLQRSTLPMLRGPRSAEAADAPPAESAVAEELREGGIAEARTADQPPSVAPPAAPPSRPALSRAEIHSIFQDLSDGLEVPTGRSAVPASEVVQYAEPHHLRSKNKTPVPEAATLVRKSVLDGVLSMAPAPSEFPSPLWRDSGARQVASRTVRTEHLRASPRARVGAVMLGAAVVGLLGVLFVRGQPSETEQPIPQGAAVLEAAPPSSLRPLEATEVAPAASPASAASAAPASAATPAVAPETPAEAPLPTTKRSEPPHPSTEGVKLLPPPNRARLVRAQPVAEPAPSGSANRYFDSYLQERTR